MHAFDNTCQRIQDCNGCKDRYTFLNMYVNIFKTAMDVIITYAYMNIFKTPMDVRIAIAYMNVKITYACLW